MGIKNILTGFNKLSKEAKASVIYTLSSFLAKGMSLITVPVFTRLMSTEQMGVVNLFTSWQGIIGSVASLSLTSGGFMVALKEYKNERMKYISSILSLTSILAIAVMMVYLVNPGFWNEKTGLSSALMLLMLVGFIVSPAMDFWLAYQRYEYRYLKAGIVIILSSVISAFVSIGAVLLASSKKMTQLGEIRLISGCSVVFIISFIIWIRILINGKTLYNKEYWTFSLKLSLPLVANSIAMQILGVFDRAMIDQMVGKSEVGIYGVLYTVSSLSLILWGAINSSFVPYLYENMSKQEKIRDIKSISTKLIMLYGGACFLITLLAPEIIIVLAPKDYLEAIYIMPPIAAGVFFTSLSNLYSNIIIYYKKTNYIMISSIIAAIINVILNYYWIRRWGYMAAAYSTLVSYIILALIQMIVAEKVEKKYKEWRVYDSKLLIIVALVTTIACMISLFLYDITIFRWLFIVVFMIVLAFEGVKYMKNDD